MTGLRPPCSEQGPGRDGIWLLHLATGLLIDPLVIAGQTRPLLKERHEHAKPKCHILGEALPTLCACAKDQRMSPCLNILDSMPC
jgi:hypothetical protein